MTTIRREHLSSDQSEIVSLAMVAARHQGNGTPRSISWVYATRGDIAAAMEFGVPRDPYDRTQILVQVSGVFKPRHRHPRGVVLPASADFITLVVRPADWSITDFGIGDVKWDLDSLGAVLTLFSPDTAS